MYLVAFLVIALATAGLFFFALLDIAFAVRPFRLLLMIAGTFILFLASFGLAMASPSTQILLPAGTADEINQLVIALIIGLGTLLWKWIDAHSPFKNTQAEAIARDAFMTLLDKGAEFGASQITAEEKKVGSFDVGNASVAAGANFVIAHGPILAKAMGFDVTTPEGQAAIVRSITGRVAAILAQPNAPRSMPLPADVLLAGTPAKATA